MTSSLDYGAGTHVGLVRSNNEDNFLADPEIGLWLIADGMGGHDAGEVASQIVRDSVYQAIRNNTPLADAIHQSHDDVKSAAEQNIGSPNMGTTIIALLSKDNFYQVAWVGDSRAYLWDPMQHHLKQLSKDHSYVQALVDSGAITPEEMSTHAQKNIITQSLGVSSLDRVSVDIIEGEWAKGQKILLCSDGLSDLVSDDEISHTIRRHHQRSNQEIVDRLIQLALDKGGQDNVTIEIISAPENSGASQHTSGRLSPAALFGMTVAAGVAILALIVAGFLLN
ncbi:MAG TPA: PP2C family serine/threonine-protein phosphatase [Pseudomonadales bacterium]